MSLTTSSVISDDPDVSMCSPQAAANYLYCFSSLLTPKQSNAYVRRKFHEVWRQFLDYARRECRTEHLSHCAVLIAMGTHNSMPKLPEISRRQW
jgi:hypothetical protein